MEEGSKSVGSLVGFNRISNECLVWIIPDGGGQKGENTIEAYPATAG